MNYKKEQFNRCQFNPVGDILENHPELEVVSKDEKLLRYIIALYDPNSPLVSQFKDIGTRKKIAAEFAGYVLDDIKDILNLKDPEFLSSLMRFFTEFAYPREWFMICANEQTFYEFGERMMQPIKVQDKEKDEISAIAVKTKLSEDMQDINSRIEGLYKKMFGEEVKDVVVTKKRFTSPEKVATGV